MKTLLIVLLTLMFSCTIQESKPEKPPYKYRVYISQGEKTLTSYYCDTAIFVSDRRILLLYDKDNRISPLVAPVNATIHVVITRSYLDYYKGREEPTTKN